MIKGYGVEYGAPDNLRSKITNCTIIAKDEGNEPLFYFLEDGGVIVNLDGYAIIPMEVYEEMKKYMDRYKPEKCSCVKCGGLGTVEEIIDGVTNNNIK